jgi:hypothetical protein
MKKNRIWVWMSGLIIITLMLSACNLSNLIAQKIEDVTSDIVGTALPEVTTAPGETVPTTNPDGVYGSAFASYQIQQVNIPDEFTSGYTLPLTADQVLGLDDENLTISAAQQQALLNNGFVVVPPSSDPSKIYSEFYQVYESNRYGALPVFITTDSIFHVYHLIFDKMLRDLEKTSFIPILMELTTAMLDSSLQQYESLKGTDLEQAALRNVAYFAVPARILELPVDVPAEAKSLADQEIALMDSKSPMSPSPIWTMGGEHEDDLLNEDYSQYIPRGHYTLSPALEKYFRAMMWYGRLTFRLKYTIETQRALLMIQAMRSAQTASGKTATELWQNIYDPTVFIVGKADDLSFHEYGALSDQIFGSTPDLISFADSAKMDEFNTAAKNLPPPQINSMWVYIWQDRDEATQGFRFMGQRFTLDQYVFGQLIYRKVGTIDIPRSLPKGLDLLAAMGSDEAYNLLDQMGETEYENFDTQMTKVKGEVANFGVDSWTQNLYWAWLYSMQPIFAVKGPQYPAFMQNQAWLHKDMATALSTWTELKHDTILYAKQVMAEMGGGAEDEPPKGYVEPNPEAFARLLALAQMTRSGLEERGLLDETTQGNLDNLIDELQFLLTIVQSELNGTTISDDDYWRIHYYGGWLEAMTIAAADPPEDDYGHNYLEDQKSALVADVASGFGSALEQGVGYPTEILVVSPLAPYHLTFGAVYTYYEFIVPANERLTDEAWRELLESGNAPPMPDWTKSYIIP